MTVGLASFGGRAATQLPLQANLVTHFDAATVAGTNGSSVSSWTDSINGIVAGTQVGTLPTLATNRIHGLPSISFGGAGGLAIATPGVLKTAIDSQDFTVFIVFRTLGAKTNGALFSATAGGSAFFYLADGTNLEKFSASTPIPFSGQSNFTTFGSAAFKTTPSFSSSGALEVFYVNGGSVGTVASAAVTTGTNTLTIGSNAANNFPVNAEIFDILVWNAPLTPPQYMQAHMWACDKYNQAYPWTSLNSFNVFFGDSITAGVGATSISKQPAWLAAQTLGLGLGQWHDLAVGGITTDNMSVLAPTWIDPLANLIRKKINLVGFEWHNENISGAPPLPFNSANTYLAARKLIPNLRTVWGTSTSESTDPIANRASYNSAFDAAHTSNIDVYMALHADTNIGVDGSHTTNPTYWSDGVHLSDVGYPFLASLFVTGIQALP